jgi:hypothetical protein
MYGKLISDSFTFLLESSMVMAVADQESEFQWFIKVKTHMVS